MQREVGSASHELLPVREGEGGRRVGCPRQGKEVPFTECQACAHGTLVRLKGAAMPFMLCPSDGEAPTAMVLSPRAPVSTIMTRAVTVRPSHTVEKLIRVFLDENVTAAVVVDETGAAFGMVTRTDVLSDEVGWQELRDATLSSWPAGSPRYDAIESEDDCYLHDLLRNRTVGDVMTRGLVWVSAELSIPAAAEVMAMSGLQHLPVLGPHDKPVGMLSAFELAQWLGAQR